MARQRKPRRKMTREQRRKAIYVLPNLFTTASLFAGFYCAVSAIDGNYLHASIAVFVSLVFDGLDGRVARATKTTSRFGVEYDSLADLVAFGVAPAIMLYVWALEPLGRLGFIGAFLFAACGALRLARFNVAADDAKPHKHFTGLPIPAAACMLASTVMMWTQLSLPMPFNPYVALGLMFVLSFLMVSNIQYLSFKSMGVAKLRSFNGVVASLLVFVLVALQPYLMGFLLMALYVAGGPIGARLLERREAAKEPAPEIEPEPGTSSE